MTRFFLLALRNSAVTGLKIRRRQSSRTGPSASRRRRPARGRAGGPSLTLLPAERRPQPEVEVLHVRAARTHDLLGGGQDLLERLEMQAEAREVGRPAVFVLTQGEGEGVSLRLKDS